MRVPRRRERNHRIHPPEERSGPLQAQPLESTPRCHRYPHKHLLHEASGGLSARGTNKGEQKYRLWNAWHDEKLTLYCSGRLADMSRMHALLWYGYHVLAQTIVERACRIPSIGDVHMYWLMGADVRRF
jgi:hypothetical protein